MTAIFTPDTVPPRDGVTDFSTYAVEDIKYDHSAHKRIRVSQGDALRVTRLEMADEDTKIPLGIGHNNLYEDRLRRQEHANDRCGDVMEGGLQSHHRRYGRKTQVCS